MTQFIESHKLKYVLDETSFHESRFANIVVPDASGPLHPSASFTLFGHLSLSENGMNLTVSVSAKGVIFSPEAGLERVEWLVTAALRRNQQNLSEKRVVRTYQHYLTSPGTTVVGEVTFTLPSPTFGDDLSVYIEGTYLANFGPYTPAARPLNPPIFGKQVYARKTIKIRVENEKECH